MELFAHGQLSTRLASGHIQAALKFVLTAWAYLGIAVNLLLLLALTHLCFPRARSYTRKFYELSYANPVSGRYAKGWDDSALVGFSVVVFTGLRVAVMEYVLAPLAEAFGIEKRKDKVRFTEQTWVFLYNLASWSMGMVRSFILCGCFMNVRAPQQP